MISDLETNKLFLADCIQQRQPSFLRRFEKVLERCNIPYQFLPGCKDIWAVDFMPVQVSKDSFVQFKYNPDYLQDRLWLKTISDVDAICKAIGQRTKKSNLIVDGGNVSKFEDKVIMCDKVFHENYRVAEKQVISELKDLFEVDNLFFVPWDTNDITGHVDGMVRFIDRDTVLINDYSKEQPEFQTSFRMALHNAGLEWIEIPYNPSSDSLGISAKGLYLNYLQMEQAVIMPTFKHRFDKKAHRVLEEVFKGQTVETVDCSDLAMEGGVLNCISWNVYRDIGLDLLA